jgi:hypothetical protein
MADNGGAATVQRKKWIVRRGRCINIFRGKAIEKIALVCNKLFVWFFENTETIDALLKNAVSFLRVKPKKE